MILDQALEMAGGNVYGVLHLGANKGQEAEMYRKFGVKKVVWVEADPSLIEELNKNVTPDLVIQAAVWSCDKDMTFHLASNNGESSSLLEFGTAHAKNYPHITYTGETTLRTTTVDQLAKDHDLKNINMLSLDLQGAEAAALSGAWRFLRQIDYVYTEISFEEVYKGGAYVRDIEQCLPHFTCPILADTTLGWGDAFYIRYKTSANDIRARF